VNAPVTIALDAMGGDQAPKMVIRGANIAKERHPNIHFLLFGDKDRLERLLKRRRRLRKHVTICHTEQVVSSDARPAAALRGSRDSSMRRAIDAVAKGEASGVVSAGNTGALMGMAKLVLKTLPGIDRPAITAFFPTLRGESVMLDLGANIDCDPNNLIEFALMGQLFSRTVLGLVEPTVGLLNVGSEDMKGHQELKDAHALLRSGTIPVNYHGFIEGDDIAAGTVDVIVTDGFTGNVALKSAEGTARLVTQFLRETFKSSIASRIGYLFARRAFTKFRVRIDPRRYNGAMFLGLNGIVVKSHGGTDAIGFANAIGVAVDLVTGGFNERIKDEFGRTEANGAKSPAAKAAV
jgi:glycerol-3-phosphate acyltransferase PlsX